MYDGVCDVLLYILSYYVLFLFFFNETATTEIYTYLHTLSLHDALPIFVHEGNASVSAVWLFQPRHRYSGSPGPVFQRFKGRERPEEHTSELQSLMRISYAVFCLKKKKKNTTHNKNPTKNEQKTQTQQITH